jgi:hypothetical protein
VTRQGRFCRVSRKRATLLSALLLGGTLYGGAARAEDPAPEIQEVQAPLQIQSPAINPEAVTLTEADAPINTWGDINFMRAVGIFPSGPLFPYRKAREEAGGTLGWSGRNVAVPSELGASDFFPVPDRWRIALPAWDRWPRGLPIDQYHQNVLKGDYPILGSQNLFFNITALSDSFGEDRELPAKVGFVNQRQFKQTFFTELDLFQGDGQLHPSEWFVKVTPIWPHTDTLFQGSHTSFELAETFVDIQVGVFNKYYDQADLRLGRQNFNADFLGFLYNDIEDGARFFGTALENRIQYNVVAFHSEIKDPVSFFDTFNSRDEWFIGGNIVRQDPGDLFGFGRLLGLNVLAGAFWNHDNFKQNVDVGYFELAADGRIGRINVDAAFIQAVGHDDFNPVAKRSQEINGQFAELTVAYPIDWIVPQVAALYASGDHHPTSGTGTGFDAPFDNPNFAGAGFSFWDREALNNVGGQFIKNAFSVLPNLRNRFQAPTNFDNPGLLLLNAGINAKITTRLNLLANFNYYSFMAPEAVEQAVFDNQKGRVVHVGHELGFEVNAGFVYKPFIIDQYQLAIGTSAFMPGDGIKSVNNGGNDTLYTLFAAWTMFY